MAWNVLISLTMMAAFSEPTFVDGVSNCDGSSPDANARPLVSIYMPRPKAETTVTVVLCFDIPPESESSPHSGFPINIQMNSGTDKAFEAPSPRNGFPTNIQIISSTDKTFEASALRSVRAWKYPLKLVDGKPAWRRGVVATMKYYGPEDKAISETVISVDSQDQLNKNSFCGRSNDVLKIKTSCICAVDDVTTLPWLSDNRPPTNGYVGYVSKATIRKIGLSRDVLHLMQPVKLTGKCKKDNFCAEGVRVKGSVQACLVYTNWDRFFPKRGEYVVSRGEGNETPRVYLQNIPEKPVE